MKGNNRAKVAKASTVYLNNSGIAHYQQSEEKKYVIIRSIVSNCDLEELEEIIILIKG